jgi:DNA-binding NtrC family response regulator
MLIQELRILLIDEESILCGQLNEYAEFNRSVCCLSCHQVKTVLEADIKISTWTPSTIILDAHTDIGNIIELTNTWRNYASIVVITEYYNPEVNRSVINHGATISTVRPQEMEDIEVLVSQLLEINPERSNNHRFLRH